MARTRIQFPRPSHAPRSAGAFLILLLTLVLSSCGEEQVSTPDWETTGNRLAVAPGPATPPEIADDEVADESDAAQLRFVAYNLKNYLTMSRWVDGERTRSTKPEEEIAAALEVLTAERPHVIGLCEIGSKGDLQELQFRLREAGLDLPYLEHAGGADETRHLGLLSSYPIVSHDSQSDLFYTLDGARTQIRRGILDATVEADGRQIRFLGVHLKSKREIKEADQEMIRRNEAYLLRKRADEILEENPEAHLVVYGDFNDTRRSPAVRSISGPGNSSGFLEPLSLKDERGEVWTHFWDYQHVYSRFDYILVSRALRPLVENEKTRIVDHPEWNEASDHRATLATFAW